MKLYQFLDPLPEKPASGATNRDSSSFLYWAMKLSPNNGLQSWRNLEMLRILNALFLIILHFAEMILGTNKKQLKLQPGWKDFVLMGHFL